MKTPIDMDTCNLLGVFRCRCLFRLPDFDLIRLWLYLYRESVACFEWKLRILCYFGRDIDEVFVVLLSPRGGRAVDESTYSLKRQIGVTYCQHSTLP